MSIVTDLAPSSESLFAPSLPTLRITKVIVRFPFEGFHRWPEAQGERNYLATRHRHIFHFTVELQVFHGDREIEIHDLRDDCLQRLGQVFPSAELGSSSCEDLASLLVNHFWNKYFGQRWVKAQVMEDNENGASVETPPPA
jgi:hypothetical protein